MKRLCVVVVVLSFASLSRAEITEQMARDKQTDAEGEYSGCVDSGIAALEEHTAAEAVKFEALQLRATLKDMGVPDEELANGDALIADGNTNNSMANQIYVNDWWPHKQAAEQSLIEGNQHLQNQEWALAYADYEDSITESDLGIADAISSHSYASSAREFYDMAYATFEAIYELLTEGEPV